MIQVLLLVTNHGLEQAKPWQSLLKLAAHPVSYRQKAFHQTNDTGHKELGSAHWKDPPGHRNQLLVCSRAPSGWTCVTSYFITNRLSQSSLSSRSTRLIQLKVLIIQTHLIGLVWKHQVRELTLSARLAVWAVLCSRSPSEYSSAFWCP